MSSEKVREIANAAFKASNYRNLHGVFVPPIQNLTDTDFYKFSMGQFIHKYYPNVEVMSKLIVRDKNIPLWKYVDLDDLRQALDHIQSLLMRKTDLYYLRGMDLYGRNMFSEEYLDFLRMLKLSGYDISMKEGRTEISFKGLWSHQTYWETLAMPVISELYYRGVMKGLPEADVQSIFAVADNRLQNNLLEIKKHPYVFFADFGTRRRFSHLWHKYAIGEAKRVLPKQFTGTSNVYMASHHDLESKGTFAHEPTMVVTALAKSIEEMRNAQYKVLEQWQEMHGRGLRIILPDTYGSEQFFANAPEWLRDWTGHRQDSGDPVVEIERYNNWLKQGGVNPSDRISIPSDGLTVSSMIVIAKWFKDKTPTPNGWGTGFANDFAGTLPGNDHMRPFSMVIKAYQADDNYCVKLSNDVNKATGPKSEIARYIEVFGAQHRVAREVLV